MRNKNYQTIDLTKKFHSICDYDAMSPFFMTLVSPCDLWLFISSTGGITAGRKTPEHCIFPYETVDKLTQSWRYTGSRTFINLQRIKNNIKSSHCKQWNPFDIDHICSDEIKRTIRKSYVGDKIEFEEINLSLNLRFSYSLEFSPQFGIVRKAKIENLSEQNLELEILDGLLNILPANTNKKLQLERSCLLDAYKRAELSDFANLAIYYYNSLPTDKPEAIESLKSTVVWSCGLKPKRILLSDKQLAKFAKCEQLFNENESRGLKGAYLLNYKFNLLAHQRKEWYIVADTDKDITDIAKIAKLAKNQNLLKGKLLHDIENARDELQKIIFTADGLQITGNEKVTAHHISNVLFNCIRGGIFANNGKIIVNDFIKFISKHNKNLTNETKSLLKKSPKLVSLKEFRNVFTNCANKDLKRLALEYLPLTFSRRHGDPSRPWNTFTINVKDKNDQTILDYQGNWRDLFQNWEALCYSFPQFTENVIAKFLNCSTAEGYNPYRISRDGFEWECPDPHDPWANIGFWGDHQLIYLLRLLEFLEKINPERLDEMLSEKSFAYANIPYKIKTYEEIIKNPRDTIIFDEKLNSKLQDQSSIIGNDAKLLKDKNGNTIHVDLVEKLLITSLAKIANLVPDGGIWMNTQRPEWNDANNALAGFGLSVVSTCHLHRFLLFFEKILQKSNQDCCCISFEILSLMKKISSVLSSNIAIIKTIASRERKQIMDRLGEAYCEFRKSLYTNGLSGKNVKIYNKDIASFISLALKWTEQTILKNERKDGLFNSYNVLILEKQEQAKIKFLPEMLEGQVAVLSSGLLTPQKATRLLLALSKSSLFRRDQNSYMLQPDKKLKSFFEKNTIPYSAIKKSQLIKELIKNPANPLIKIDVLGKFHFDSDIKNEEDLNCAIEKIRSTPECAEFSSSEYDFIRSLYEETFNHSEFTGRAGSFFAYEGLGCIYWHMVSKLLLAVQEIAFSAIAKKDIKTARQLTKQYYEIRQGLGFNKTVQAYGAFPTDPYSHTPKHSGASQPGMTGQVKEEIITRLGELGVSYSNGQISFSPTILRKKEFFEKEVNISSQLTEEFNGKIILPKNSLLFTLCSIPVLYILYSESNILIYYKPGRIETIQGSTLDSGTSQSIFERDVKITKITVHLRTSNLPNIVH